MYKERTIKFSRHRIEMALAWYKYKWDSLNGEVYDHMKLQAEGVKYKPKSKDKTYHGRKAIHALQSMCRCAKEIQRLTELLEKN